MPDSVIRCCRVAPIQEGRPCPRLHLVPAPKVPAASTKKPKSVPRRTLTAYHEAGHAVLGAAIGDSPTYITIKPNGPNLGRSDQKMLGRSEVLVQVYLAGYAAEELLTGRRSRQFERQPGFAILATDPKLATLAKDCHGTDELDAVRTLLATGCTGDDEAIRAEVERFYVAARESLAAVWAVVEGVAKALLRRGELDGDGLFEAMGGGDIYQPVHLIQREHGLLPATRRPQ